ncbi:MAG: HD-GYP domain-containing protein [Vulcanimicrobiaceae bacterium]
MKDTVLLRRLGEYHPETYRHSTSVQQLAYALARQLNYADGHAEAIATAALLHDIGKLDIPTTILDAPRRLTVSEWQIVVRHPLTGQKYVDSFADPRICAWVYQHHERLDGSGYPCRLEGDEIAPEALVVATVDVWDALHALRPYSGLLSIAERVHALRKERARLGAERVDALLALLVPAGMHASPGGGL